MSSVIDVKTVSGEFCSLVERRRRHATFLFSAVAAFAVLFDGVLQEKMPKALLGRSSEVIEGGAVALGLLAFVTAFREARIHRGLMANGVLLKLLADTIELPRKNLAFRDPLGLRLLGVSAVLSLLAVSTAFVSLSLALLLAGFSTTQSILVATGIPLWAGGYYWLQHDRGVTLGLEIWSFGGSWSCGVDDYRQHLTASIADAQRDMLELLAISGLLIFAAFQFLAGLGELKLIEVGRLERSHFQDLVSTALPKYVLFCTSLAILAYIRLRITIGEISIVLDARDEPFRARSMDDSFFGLLILLALWGFNLLLVLSPKLPVGAPALSAGTVAVVLVVERLVVHWHGNSVRTVARTAMATGRE